MIDVAGKPMVQWVINALDAAPSIGRIVVVGLEESSRLTSRKPLFFHPDQGSFFANIAAGISRLSSLESAAEFGLGISGDIPGIKPEMLDWLAAEGASAKLDAQYLVVRREVVEARFPGSGRTFLRFRDGHYCGGKRQRPCPPKGHSLAPSLGTAVPGEKNTLSGWPGLSVREYCSGFFSGR